MPELTLAQLYLKPGDPVWYERDPGIPGPTRHSVERCAPFKAADGSLVVFLSGISGYVALERVTPRVVSLRTMLTEGRTVRRWIDDLLADAAEWNQANPDDAFDPDPDGELGRQRRGISSVIEQIEGRLARGDT